MYLRKLPSGKWQATVRKPDGKKVTRTDRLKSVVKDWALKQEAKFRSGDRRDPRAGEVKLGDWRKRVRNASGLERPTLAKHDSLWRTHCEEEWAAWPMNAVTRTEAQGWVNRLKGTTRARHKGRVVIETEGVPLLKASTIHEVVFVMGNLYVAAMTEDPPLVVTNPFAKLDLPKIEPRTVEFYERDEADLLYATVMELSGLKWRTLIELGMDVGLRPGEAYGLHANQIDWIRGLITITHVMTRYGLREYPKSKKSHRTVPVPPHTLKAMRELMGQRTAWGVCACPKVLPDGSRVPGGGPCPGLIFPAAQGGPIDDGNFRDRIWNVAVEAARPCGQLSPGRAQDTLWTVGECGPKICDDPSHKLRRFPPKIMRHTAASWLVQDGVPLYDVQHLLGHESFATTQRYAHLAPEAHSKVIESWKRRASAPRSSEDGARAAHDMQEARLS